MWIRIDIYCGKVAGLGGLGEWGMGNGKGGGSRDWGLGGGDWPMGSGE